VVKQSRAAFLLLAMVTSGPITSSAVETSTFIGTTPANAAVRTMLGVPKGATVDMIEWKLTLEGDRYRATARYGPAVANQPGLAPSDVIVERRGRVTESTAERGGRDVTTYELEGLGTLERVSRDVLHFLKPDDHGLMVGHSGESFSLLREGAGEAADSAPAGPPSGLSYKISPVAEGPTVYGVFEGRTPCRGVAAVLRIEPGGGCFKAKWRVTLFQDPSTRHPAAYLVEGSLFRDTPRQGSWRFVGGRAGTKSPAVIELTAPGLASIRLQRADANVLFFVDENDRPLVGNERFSYVLNRRGADAKP
jgi:hypothetical protein